MLPSVDHLAERAGQRRGPAASISANILGPDLGQIAEHTRSGRSRRRSGRQPDRAEDQPEHLEPRVHVAVDRKRAADLGVRHVDGRQHAAARGLGDDQISFYKEGTEQYPVKIRPRGSAPRHRGDRAADRAVGERTGPHRQHRADRARPRADHAAALEPAVHVSLIADVAPGHALDEAANDVRRMLTASTCRRPCRSGCRDRPRSWTRPRPT